MGVIKMSKAVRDSVVELLAKHLTNLSSLSGISKVALPFIEKKLYKSIVEEGDPIDIGPRRQREDKYYIGTNLVRIAFKAYDRSSPGVRKRISQLLLNELVHPKGHKVQEEFKAKYGIYPPGLLVISPGGICNLRCKDCYAASLPKDMPSLSAEVVEKILNEKYEKWGSWFTVISGGEPFMWRDGDIDIIEIARRHPEQYFLVYTNGTLIDEKTAERLAEVGNISPGISVEGFEEETDKRRGKGVFKRILAAFENLRNAGVPFGISVTATPENAELLISKEMIKFYFDEQGALYEWIFQYMPIGRGINVKRQIPPEIRRKMWYREQELLRKERLFVADFWNCGSYSSGCIAGGRPGGYLYIDWNGNICPCAFLPYWKDNINEVYAQGRTLTDALFSDLFKGVREWQRSYNYQKPPYERGNEMRPCIMRDHHKEAHNLIIRTNANPAYPEADTSIKDPEYYKQMLEYDEEVAKLLDPIWDELYKEPKKV